MEQCNWGEVYRSALKQIICNKFITAIPKELMAQLKSEC